MNIYPEHDKLSEVKEKSQAIGEFLEWYGSEGGGVWARYPSTETGDVMLSPQRLLPDHRPIDELLALYFEIDKNKLEEEKRAMLEELRRAA